MITILMFSLIAAAGGLAILGIGALLLDLAGKLAGWIAAGYRADERRRGLRALRRINGRDLKDIGRLA
jgi:hypothetical protein